MFNFIMCQVLKRIGSKSSIDGAKDDNTIYTISSTKGDSTLHYSNTLCFKRPAILKSFNTKQLASKCHSLRTNGNNLKCCKTTMIFGTADG